MASGASFGFCIRQEAPRPPPCLLFNGCIDLCTNGLLLVLINVVQTNKIAYI